MLYLHSSNRLEKLLEMLLEVLSYSPVDLVAGGAAIVGDRICVQSLGMRTWLKRSLAKEEGVWAGGVMPFPAAVVHTMLKTAFNDDPESDRLFDRRVMALEIFRLLSELIDREEFSPVASFFRNEVDGSSRISFAIRMAGLFDEYLVYRPALLRSWQNEQPAQWQPMLWNALMSRRPVNHFAERTFGFSEQVKRIAPDRLPRNRFCLFGITTLPPSYMEIIAAWSELRDVHLFLLSPTPNYFGDVTRTKKNEAPLTGNRLLTDLGGLGRDFQNILTDATENRPRHDMERYVDPGENGRDTLLSMIQSDIFHMIDRRAGGVEEPVVLNAPDHSIAIHSCRSSLREVEVLHDQLLQLFNDDPSLRPSDILVMAPDMDEYAPLIDAVFLKEDATGVSIPYNVSDAASQEESPIGKALQALFSLSRSRLPLQEVFDFLSIEPVCEKYGLSLEDVDVLLQLCLDAGIRFGEDASHRDRMGQPPFNENTWRFGLDRLILGYAMAADHMVMFNDVLPFEGIEAGRASLVEILAEFVDDLFGVIRAMQEERTIVEWGDFFKQVASRLFADSENYEEDIAALQAALVSLSKDAQDAALAERVSLATFVQLFSPEFSGEVGHNRFLSGGVTVCRMLPMRSIPFRVVCLLGMNNGDFPRNYSAPGFNLMARAPQPGDRNPRSDDKYLFLESLLSAREKLIIFYKGGSYQDNAPRQPSPLVSALKDTIDDGFIFKNVTGPASEALVVVHPLKAYSTDYFDSGDPRLFSYDRLSFEAAAAVQERGRNTNPPFLTAPIQENGSDDTAISLEEMLSFFKSPHQFFVDRMLGIRLAKPAAQESSREPFALNRLDQYLASDALLQGVINNVSFAQTARAIRAAGGMPLGTPGSIALSDLEVEVEAMARCLKAEKSSEVPVIQSVSVPLQVGDLNIRIEGRIHGIAEGRRLQHVFSKLNGKHLLSAWVSHLVWSCAVAPAGVETILFGRPEKDQSIIRTSFGVVSNPSLILAELTEIYLRGRRLPPPLFAKEALDYARRVQKNGNAPFPPLNGDGYRSGILDEPACELIYRGRSPLRAEESWPDWNFHDVSMKVFEPLLRHCIETKVNGEAS